MANNRLSKLKRIQEQALAFFEERGIAHQDDAQRSLSHRFAHFWLLVGKSFVRNRCPVRASALAYTTLLALVPLLAVGASILTGFLQTKGKEPIDEMVKGLVENVAPMLNLQVKIDDAAATNKLDEAVNKITDFVRNIKVETLGLTGIVALVFVAIALLRTIEATFNDIWGVTRGRGLVESVIHYFAALAGGPLILALVLGLTTGPHFDATKRLLGLSLLSEKDLTDVPRLVTKFKEKSDPLSVYLSSQFDESLQKTLQNYNATNRNQSPLRKALVQNLNRILRGPSIYESERFAGKLSQDTYNLLAKNPKGQELVRLNRSLLEDAYRAEVTVKEESFLGTFAFQLLPFVVLSLAFGLFYKLMPNTCVHAKAALIGGIVGGTLWQLNNKLSVFYVAKVLSYSQIYGSLSIIPLFLIGLYFSWLIVLFGAQVAYAFQNRQSYLQEKQSESVNQRGREFVALRVMTNLAQHFQRGAKPPSVNQLAAALGVPSRLVGRLMQPLLQAKLVVEVIDEETGYAPARPLNQITAHDILTALRVGQGTELETIDDGTRGYVRGKFESIYGAERDVAADMTLETLANGAPAVPVSASPGSA